jgi:CxxC motif-containing protein (DUF1111 family)
MACDKILPKLPADDSVLDGPVEGLSAEQHAQFLKGDVAFNDDIFTTETGLGPLFVANSCGSCHAGDGKGHPFTTLTRFGQSDTIRNQYLNQGGPQLQHRAIPGYQPEQIPAGATFSSFILPIPVLAFDAVPDATLLSNADETDANGWHIRKANRINIPPVLCGKNCNHTQEWKIHWTVWKESGSI